MERNIVQFMIMGIIIGIDMIDYDPIIIGTFIGIDKDIIP